MQSEAFGGEAESTTVVAMFDGGNQMIDFFFSPLWGVVGDKVGRKPLVVLFASVKALAIVSLACGFSLYHFYALDDLLPFPGCISGGVAGAYIADLLVADHEDDGDEDHHSQKVAVVSPATAFAFYQASLFFGEAVGTIVGPLVQEHGVGSIPGGVQGVMTVAALIYVANVFWTIVALPESLQPHHKDVAEVEGEKSKSIVAEILQKGNPVGAVKLIYSLGPMLVAYVMLMMAMSLVSAGVDNVKDQYMAVHNGIRGKDLSLLHVFLALTMVFGNMFLTPFLTHRIGQRRTLYVGIILSAVGLVALGLLQQELGAYVSFGLFSLGSVWSPAIQGSIARATPPSKQGSMQAALAALLALGMAVAPLPFSYLFKYTAQTAPYAVCFLGAAIMALSTALTFNKIMYSSDKQRYHSIFHKANKGKAANARELLNDETPYEVLE